MAEDNTVGQKFQTLINKHKELESNPSPKNSPEYQLQTLKLINEFILIGKIVAELDLFSDNEILEEINVNYLPFLNVDYYLALLYLNFMSNDKLETSIDYKADNLQKAKDHFHKYLNRLVELELLNPLQIKQFNGYNLNREEKISQYKYEKELQTSLGLIETTQDEDTKRNLYVDEINLYTIKTLNQLQMLEMELIVLSNRPKDAPKTITKPDDSDRQPTNLTNPADRFTTRLETLPQNQPFSKLVNKGKVLQPFTLTRQELKNKVFGTGQVLPSMTVEEYLDHELANGKMAAPEPPAPGSDEEDEENEEAEREAREWDDWKDDNPKGAGNTMNMG